MTTIDLNCDLGEGFGAWAMGNDAAMIKLATSVNVACGFHAGDADIMRRTVELAKARGVSDAGARRRETMRRPSAATMNSKRPAHRR